MELRHLRYFLAVAEELNFSKAAIRVHIEQSPLSRSIKNLENQLGVQLLVRTSKTTKLTYAGKLFLVETRKLLNMADQAQDKVREMAGGRLGYLRIGTADGLAHRQLSKLMFSYRTEEPELKIQLRHLSMADLISELRCYQLDIGIGVPTMLDHYTGISIEPLWPEQFIGILSPSHIIGASHAITISDIERIPLILGRSEIWQSTYQFITPKIAEASGFLKNANYASGHESMLLMAESGLGLGFAFASQLEGVSRSHIIKKNLELVLSPIHCCALWLTDAPPPALEKFIARARQI